jgi:hypothetical protein
MTSGQFGKAFGMLYRPVLHMLVTKNDQSVECGGARLRSQVMGRWRWEGLLFEASPGKSLQDPVSTNKPGMVLPA